MLQAVSNIIKLTVWSHSPNNKMGFKVQKKQQQQQQQNKTKQTL